VARGGVEPPTFRFSVREKDQLKVGTGGPCAPNVHHRPAVHHAAMRSTASAVGSGVGSLAHVVQSHAVGKCGDPVTKMPQLTANFVAPAVSSIYPCSHVIDGGAVVVLDVDLWLLGQCSVTDNRGQFLREGSAHARNNFAAGRR
jgi:hypothetical protein